MTCARCSRDNWEIPECRNSECPYEAKPKPEGANARQVGGTHYRGKMQHWDFVEKHGLGYVEGNATKYLSRWRNKNGLQDLEKSQHYVDKLIELSYEGRGPRGFVPVGIIRDFCNEHELSETEFEIFKRLCKQWTLEDLVEARDLLRHVVSVAKAGLPL
jgi:hypothetical protein